jgi:lipopolysaccharide export system ATP-binding protein
VKLHTTNIKKTYKGRDVVKGVSIEVNQGEIVGLLGPNGAGKTTSFYMIVGLVKPDEGNVYLDSTDITHFPMYKRSQLGIGYLPQEVSVFRKLSVEDNIMAILEMTALNKQERKDRLEQLLEEFSLNHVRKNLGDRLSGLRKKNIGILITDHNVQETLSITDRAYLLFEGSILKSGTAEELAADEQVRRVYLGQNFELRKK